MSDRDVTISRLGINRRQFMKYCTATATAMGLSTSVAPRIAAAITSSNRPPVIWLHGQECTGCTETLLRPSHPTLDHLILDLISLDYHETLSAGAGHQAEHFLQESVKANRGKFILVIEGAVPVKDGGVYCQVGGRPFLDIVQELGPQAAAVIAIGSCASWGGIQSAPPNPTGASGVPAVLKGIPVVTLPGCPPHPQNFLSTVIHFLTFKKLPALDDKGRPLFAYGRLIHENCERRPHFDAGRFATRFGDEGHRLGYCLYKLGCKGPITHANCPSQLFCEVGSGAWPVGTGHPCFGCVEEDVAFHVPLFTQAGIHNPTPAAQQPSVQQERDSGLTTGGAALAGAAVGIAVGASMMAGKKAADRQDDEE
jgi:hydrogenase small subunit